MPRSEPPPRLVALPPPGPSLSLEDRVAAYLEAAEEGEARLHLELLALTPSQARAALLGVVRDGRAQAGDEVRLVAALERVGWAGVLRALEALVGDKAAARPAREMALRVLARRDGEQGRPAGPTEGVGLGAAFIAGVVGAADGAARLLDFLELSPVEVRGPTIALLDSVRRTERIPASLVWGEAAKAPWIVEEHPEVLDALVEEASAEAEQALHEACAIAEGRHRRGLDAALLRVRTARIEPAPEVGGADVTALVSACDGSGAFQVLVAFPSQAGRWTVLGVCIRAGADIRDGGLFFDLDQPLRDAFLDDFCRAAGIPAVPAPVEVAAGLVDDAVARTLASGRSLPEDVAPAVRILSGLVDARERPDLPEPGRAPSLTTVRALLRGEAYATWRFDAADLLSFGAGEPPATLPERRGWAKTAAAKVVGTRAARRLVAACEHQAWWHGWAGDARGASVFARMAADLDEGAPQHPLVVALLERARAGDGALSAMVDVGDEGNRSVLRYALEPGVAQPRGRDLAHLDLAEVSVVALDAAFARVDVGLRPRADELVALAVAVGERVVDAVVAGEGPGGVARWLAEELVADGHPRDEALAIGNVVAGAHEGFLRTVCPTCPVGCWDRLRRPMARAWRRPGHPAITGRARRPSR